MSRKRDALIREVARLFVEYKLEDWEPILSELKDGSLMQKEIAQAAQSILVSISRTRAASKRRTQRKAKKAPLRRKELPADLVMSDERRSTLEPLKAAMDERRLLPTAKAMREAYQRLGIKDQVPGERGRAIDHLILFLDGIPSDRLRKSFALISDSELSNRSNPEEDYQRWFNMITKDGERAE